MPHFVIDCSIDILSAHPEKYINEQVHLAANASGLFEECNIKVRVNPFKEYTVGNKRENFIHVFADIMEGRSTEQKAQLSNFIVDKLADMFPDVAHIAMNIRDFERATYRNRHMVE